MKLKLILLLAVLSGSAFATTTLTGSIKYPDGTGVNGTLRIHSSQQASLLSTGGCGGPLAIAPTKDVVFNLVNGVVTSSGNGLAVYDLNCLQPGWVYYVATVKDANGNVLFKENWTDVTGATKDIGSIVPASIPGSTSQFPTINVATLKDTGTVDFSKALATRPNQVGLDASKPTSCLDGQTYFSTDLGTTGTSFTCKGNVWSAAGGGGGGSGTVTSVTLTAPSDLLTITNPTITTAGTIAATKATVAQNLVYIAPVGATGIPTFRALLDADIPDNITLADINQITNRPLSSLTGQLPLAQVGAGSTFTPNRCLQASSDGLSITSSAASCPASSASVTSVFGRANIVTKAFGDYLLNDIGTMGASTTITIPSAMTLKFFDTAGTGLVQFLTDADVTHGISIARPIANRVWTVDQLNSTDTRGAYGLHVGYNALGAGVKDYLVFNPAALPNPTVSVMQILDTNPAVNPAQGQFNLSPTAVPTAPIAGDMWMDAGTSKDLQYYTGTNTRTTEYRQNKNISGGYVGLNSSNLMQMARIPIGARWVNWSAMNTAVGSGTWSSPNNGDELYGSTNYRTQMDLTDFTQVRLVVGVGSVTSGLPAGCLIEAQYTTDGTNFFDLASTAGASDSVISSIGMQYGTFTTLAAGATTGGDVKMRVIAKTPCNGSGVSDLRTVVVQFK